MRCLEPPRFAKNRYTPSRLALTSGTRIGVYEVIASLGAGGIGEVFRARDTKLNRDVALKVLPDSFASDADRLARFTREAQTLAAINHPNIAHIHGFEESGGVRAIVIQIAEALEAAHEQGIIHRDLKPANIKLRPDAHVRAARDSDSLAAREHGRRCPEFLR